ncbi:MAG TPA: patatin-like phospholipase family protein [Hyphomicrobiaceae bacterium]|nr:patatin-like phospholipase family protein [Hyphomicrobiaceae bacterium]
MINGSKIGIALGGGAARGWAHIGVLRALVQAGIKPDIIAGTSIGAVVGGCFAAGRLDELEGFARELTRRKVFGFLDFNLAGSGLITGQKLVDRLEAYLGDLDIEDLPAKFVSVATEIGTGHEVWLGSGKLVAAMRASYALPGIFKPASVGGRWLFDGALVNPVPVSVCRALGARYVIAVNLNSDLGGKGTVIQAFDTSEDTATAQPAEPEGRGARRLIARQLLGPSSDAPGISTVVVDAFNIVQDRIARSRLAGDPPDAMISPKLASIGLFEFHRADEAIQQGVMAAAREVEDLGRELALRRRIAEKPLPATIPAYQS